MLVRQSSETHQGLAIYQTTGAGLKGRVYTNTTRAGYLPKPQEPALQHHTWLELALHQTTRVGSSPYHKGRLFTSRKGWHCFTRPLGSALHQLLELALHQTTRAGSSPATRVGFTSPDHWGRLFTSCWSRLFTRPQGQALHHHRICIVTFCFVLHQDNV